MSHLLLRRILPVSVVGHDMSQLYLQKHSNTHTHTETLSSCTFRQKKTPHMITDSHIALWSAFHLGTSIPLHSLIGPQWMDYYSSTSFSFFCPPFPSSSSLFLSRHPPVTLFSATLEERKEVRGWVCEPSCSLFPFLSLLPLVFPLFLFLVSQRGEPRAP